MGQTLAEKILSRRAGVAARAGDIVISPVDLVFVQDGTGPLMVRQFQSLGFETLANPRRSIFFLDHAAPCPTRELANDHAFLRSFATRMGAVLSEVGEGISHELVAELYASPGEVIVGADSHTCTAGALAAFATGMGSTDVAVAMALGKTWFRVPESFKIEAKGGFPKATAAKDFILYLIGLLGADGATYKALEFLGEGVERMSMVDRLTVANMAVEAGAKVGLFPCDEETRSYLQARGRGNAFPSLSPDPDARYERTIAIDLSRLEPMVARPHTVDNVAPARELKGTKVHQVFLGTCTNGRLEDLALAASILKGKKVKSRLIVAPASREVFLEAMRRGYIQTFIEAGGVVVPSGCAPCVGVHEGIPADGENCLSTANRNFQGRMGNPEAFIYLASPLTAATSAIYGEIVDPREVF